MTNWIVVVTAAAVTYLLRTSVLVAGRGRTLPAAIEARMRLVGPAVMAALVAGALFVAGQSAAMPPPGDLAAVVVAGLVVRRTRTPAHAIAVGLPVAWVVAAIGL